MNRYYLINASDIETARQYAPTEGLPNQLFQVTVSPDATKAIGQADWPDTTWLDANGTCLGELQETGSASQGVFDELAKAEWQSEE